MDQLIGMTFQRRIAVILTLRRAAKGAFPVFPDMRDAFIADIALRVLETCHGINTVGIFAAIHAAP